MFEQPPALVRGIVERRPPVERPGAGVHTGRAHGHHQQGAARRRRRVRERRRRQGDIRRRRPGRRIRGIRPVVVHEDRAQSQRLAQGGVDEDRLGVVLGRAVGARQANSQPQVPGELRTRDHEVDRPGQVAALAGVRLRQAGVTVPAPCGLERRDGEPQETVLPPLDLQAGGHGRSVEARGVHPDPRRLVGDEADGVVGPRSAGSVRCWAARWYWIDWVTSMPAIHVSEIGQ